MGGYGVSSVRWWVASEPCTANLCVCRASLIVQLVKNEPARQETLVRFLGREDPLEKGWATHCSILWLPLWLSW